MKPLHSFVAYWNRLLSYLSGAGATANEFSQPEHPMGIVTMSTVSHANWPKAARRA